MSFFTSIKKALGLEYEQPEYEILTKLNDYVEIRKYKPTKWACAQTEAQASYDKMKNESRNLFWQLFGYISGKNSDKQKISMTIPVTMDYKSENDKPIVKDSRVKVEMGFFVPPKFNENTPKPQGDNMFIKEEKDIIVATIRFSGYAKMEDFLENRDSLINQLGDQVKNYDQVNFIGAVYDSPFKPIFRKNEVWLKKIN